MGEKKSIFSEAFHLSFIQSSFPWYIFIIYTAIFNKRKSFFIYRCGLSEELNTTSGKSELWVQVKSRWTLHFWHFIGICLRWESISRWILLSIWCSVKAYCLSWDGGTEIPSTSTESCNLLLLQLSNSYTIFSNVLYYISKILV